jgi:hypothetical protein
MSEFAQKRATRPGDTHSGAFPIQRKVAVGSSQDPAEVEAERAAASVVQALAGLSRPSAASGGSGGSGAEQHEAHRDGCDCSGAEIRRRVSGPVGAEGGDLSPDVEQDLRSASGGSAIDPVVRSQLEGTMGADLSSVRLHAGERAERLNRSMSAEAFTHGRDIYFRDGLPDASTRSGLHLLAHEVAHTVQQGTSPVAPVRRMTTGSGRKETQVTTLEELNGLVRQFNIKGGAIDAEAIESQGRLDDAPTLKAINEAIATSPFEVTGKVTRQAVIGEIVNRLKNPKKEAEPMDATTLRTLGAKQLRATAGDGTGGSYFLGGADEPHVHLYSNGFHLKKFGPERINVVQDDKLYPEGLARARQAASEHWRGYEINVAIDKCLLAMKESLDEYE